MNARAAAGALSVFLGHENRPAGTGACVCPPGTVYGECACPWGELIHRMMTLGYSAAATAEIRAVQLRQLQIDADAELAAGRVRAVTSFLSRWTASVRAAGERLGLTAQGVRALAPDAVAELTARRGYHVPTTKTVPPSRLQRWARRVDETKLP